MQKKVRPLFLSLSLSLSDKSFFLSRPSPAGGISLILIHSSDLSENEVKQTRRERKKKTAQGKTLQSYFPINDKIAIFRNLSEENVLFLLEK